MRLQNKAGFKRLEIIQNLSTEKCFIEATTVASVNAEIQ